MAHKTLIDGTAYEISGGKTLVNGTAYSIKNGKTLVDGTAYEVGFGERVQIIIRPHSDGATDSTKASATINGQLYDGSTECTLFLPVGTIITCYSHGPMMVYGETVCSMAYYDYEVTIDAIIEILSNQWYGHVTITKI